MMQDRSGRRGGAVVLAAFLASMLAGCGDRVGGPAPLISGEGATPPPAQVVVERGQTLSGIAHTYHVPMQTLAEANRLSPPYRIVVGRTLIIPGGGEPAPPAAVVAALPPVAAPAAAPPPEVAPPPPAVEKSPIAAAPLAAPTKQPAPPGPPPPAARPPSTPEAAAAPPSETPPAEPAAAPPPTAPSPTAAAAAPPRGGQGAFLWPVRGRILEGYGSGSNGAHNDGINIAAPRGAPVQAADAGVVAYAGNELRGYGNLILVKHHNGWISAYAHCDMILVKKGQKVARGQIIARVGSTGSVSEPQLHFELRRGNKPVDPQEYLTTPTAATKDPHTG